MDFYVTLSGGPAPDFPNNQSSWSEYYLKEPIQLDGEYEVALVQSVFKNVFCDSLATINILPSDYGMEMHSFQMDANYDEDAETIIKNLNKKMSSSFNAQKAPFFKFDKSTLEVEIDMPEGWHYFVMDVDAFNLNQYQNKLKFKNNKFSQPKHFYVLTSLIDDQLTGNTSNPLLTNFCLPESKSNVLAYTPNQPFYVKVKDSLIKDFYFQYTSSIYEVSKLSGEIISTLHFRKINGF